MPYGWMDPEVFMEHDGVPVYHTYKNDDIENQREYWFTLDCSYSEGCGQDFDVRDLPNPRRVPLDEAGKQTVIANALDQGILEPTHD